MTTSADPVALAGYASSARALDEAIDGVARQLTRAISPGWFGHGEVLALHQRLRTLAQREAATTRWVRATGLAFERSDGGSVVSDATVDVFVDLAQPGQDVHGVAIDVWLLQRLGATPGSMAAAAEAMGPVLLAELVRHHPQLVGPVDGFPAVVRYAANHRLIATAVASMPDAARRRSVAALLKRDPVTGNTRQILLFDPSGDGRVVEVFGDLVDAGSVAVIVPGAGTDLEDFDRHVSRPVGDLTRRAQTSSPRGPVATIAWLGYDPPDGAVADGRELLALTTPDRAEAGGRALSRMMAGLDLRASQRVTLIGHSYGSTTVGAALLHGVRADNVVVMGSPGVLVDHARDFRRPETDFFVLRAAQDPVAHLGWFGGDPSRSGSGFVRLAMDGSGHSSYLVSGSLAQQQLVAVINDAPVRHVER